MHLLIHPCCFQKVIAQQRRKEALRFHSQNSAENAIKAHDAQVISASDAGHTFSLASLPQQAPQAGQDLTNITENSDEILTTTEWGVKLDRQATAAAAEPSIAKVAIAFSLEERFV